MRIAVVGAGAVGLSVAARLSTVADVYAVARKRHADAIRAHGFAMTGIWGDATYRFPCGEELPAGERFDYVIITSKSRDTEAICEQFADAVAGAETVSLQNGIGNEEVIAGYAKGVIGGMIITGFEWRGDGAVHVSVEAGPIRLGRFPAGTDEAVNALAACFRKAGMNVETSPDIRADLWGKTLYNAALNPLGAIMDVAYGELCHPAAWHVIGNIVAEAFAVCTAEGITLAWATPAGYLAYLRDVQLPATALHHSSMLQDIKAGRRTEIDFINGAVVEKGRAHGIPTPVNATLVDLIRFREHLALGRDE
ncbi:MAG: ketopantoate reductase family protein [Methanomicrobiales archaeon]|nr:ketopantoate reductase family protein [Methanomicrobiales archaeon]